MFDIELYKQMRRCTDRAYEEERSGRNRNALDFYCDALYFAHSMDNENYARMSINDSRIRNQYLNDIKNAVINNGQETYEDEDEDERNGNEKEILEKAVNCVLNDPTFTNVNDYFNSLSKDDDMSM